jgi:hypothetical protein
MASSVTIVAVMKENKVFCTYWSLKERDQEISGFVKGKDFLE